MTVGKPPDAGLKGLHKCRPTGQTEAGQMTHPTKVIRSHDYRSYRDYDRDIERQRRQDERDRYQAKRTKAQVRNALLQGTYNG